MKNTVVSTSWLHDHIDDLDLIILEVHQKINKAGLEYNVDGHIKGAIPIDLKSDFSDLSGKYSNTFPTKDIFEKTCQKLGINNDSQVIIVDRLGIYTSPRVWYIFKSMGHEKVAVLDGGLPAWISDGYDTVSDTKSPVPISKYTAQFNNKAVKEFNFVCENVKNENGLLIDARSSGRFEGTEPEPRKGIKSGSIPCSINIPFKSLLREGKFKPKDELLSIFENENLGSKDLIFSCGSGVTACILLLATELIMDNKKAIYDGSWTEWADLNDLKY